MDLKTKPITAAEFQLAMRMKAAGAPGSPGRVAVAADLQDQQKKQDRHNRGAAGKRPDLEDRFFRSKAEANYARYLNFCIEGEYHKICRWEYEVKEFEFPQKRGNNFYRPDFKVWYTDGSYKWHEVKGWMDQKSKTKLKRFAKYFPEENAKFELITMKEILAITRAFSKIIPGWEF